MRRLLAQGIPLAHLLRRWLSVRNTDLSEVCTKSWQLDPGGPSPRREAMYLPTQLARVRGVDRTSSLEHEFGRLAGGIGQHGPTTAFLLSHALLRGGRLYASTHREGIAARPVREWSPFISYRPGTCSLASTPYGSRFFGHWLMDDCNTARAMSLEPTTFGEVCMIDRPYSKHEQEYLTLLGLHCSFVDDTLFEALIVIDDRGQNKFKRQRYAWMRRTLLTGIGLAPDPPDHPGVFVLRGGSGVRRFMVNEREVAENLEKTRGFRVLDPMALDVKEILAQCAGAKVAIGIEGSALAHALMVLAPESTLLCLQPPQRFNNIYKDQADCLDVNYAFVVGSPQDDGFSIDIEDVHRTLDLVATRANPPTRS